jgi:hypothetical protein
MAPEAATEAPAAPVAASPEPREPAKAPAAKAKGASKGDKADKKGGKGKGDKKAAKGEELDAGAPSVAAHPRAARAVARAKGWGGLAGFVLGGYLSLPTNTLAGAGLRALIAGIVCYVAAWAGAVFLWRYLVILEIKGREQQIATAVQAARAPRELPPGRGERPTAKASS